MLVLTIALCTFFITIALYTVAEAVESVATVLTDKSKE